MNLKGSFPTASLLIKLILLAVLFFSNIPPAVSQTRKQADKASDMSYLSDSTQLSRSDYLEHLDKVFTAINQVKVTTGSFYKLPLIGEHLTEDEEAIKLLKICLTQNKSSLNVQNLHMYQTLLEELEKNNVKCLEDLQQYDQKLNGIKTQILSFRKDTALLKVFKVDSLRLIFKDQLTELKNKKVIMDSLIKTNTALINKEQTRTSTNLINIRELKYITDNQLTSAGFSAFGKERRYLWESADKTANGSVGFKRFIDMERQISQYYFSYTQNARLLLLLLTGLFYFWVFFNYKSLIRRDKLSAVEPFQFNLIRPRPLLISVIFLFTLAPVFDLLAPALYIEAVHLISAVSLTALFYKRLPRAIFLKWCVFVILLISPIVLRILGMPPRYQRWILLIFSIASSAFGIAAYRSLKAKAGKYRILLTIGIIYIIFNLLAIPLNLFGRFTLTQIFYSTAISAILTAIALIVLINMITEAFLLQVKSSRIRKNYQEHFDWLHIEKNIRGLLGIAAFLIWTTLFLVNLNIFNSLYDLIVYILTEKRKIGSLIFSLGGIVLFMIIIWAANFLQKYIAYFFGDTGDDALEENKGQRSKLIITRLVLLIGGFLLAVAASGLPIDKITVVLGALGVGIGLGLQNIVSNFVSGIILIFDKTLRIGDIVELSDKKGRVKEIGIRASTLLTDDGAEIIIPNGAILSNNIINWTLTNNQMRVSLEFTVVKPYDKTELTGLIKEAISLDDNIFVNKEPKVIVSPKTKTSSNVKIYFWCKDISQAESTRSSINAMIFDELEEKGIEVL